MPFGPHGSYREAYLTCDNGLDTKLDKLVPQLAKNSPPLPP